MSTLKTNNIEHLDASTPSIQTTIGGGTILAGVSTVSDALVVGGTDSTAKLNVFGGDIQIGTGLTFKSSSSIGNLNLQGGYTYPGGWIKLSGGSSDDNIVFGTSSNNATKEERVRITSAGNVGIGTTNAEERIFQIVKGSGDSVTTLQLILGGYLELERNHARKPKFDVGMASGRPSITLAHAEDYGTVTNKIRLGVTGNNYLNGSGNVGIGTDNPASKLEVNGRIRVRGPATPNINLSPLSGGDGNADISFDGDDLKIVSNSSGADVRINAVSRNNDFVLKSSGNIGIGTDNPQGKLEVYAGDGLASFIIQTPATSDAELEFRNNNGGNATWAIGLDYDDSKKFKIAYAAAEGASLSANELIAISTGGNIELASGAGIDFSATSGTGTSELLDDYEEGTWTVAMSNGITLYGTQDLASYVKIGSSVTVFGQIRVNNGNTNANMLINNLPFACASQTENETLAVGSMRLYNAAITGAAVQVVCVTADGTTILYFNEVRDNNSDLPCQATNDGYYMFNITYRTSS